QAEDGIRDDLVTGVQTCALPISLEHEAAIRAVHEELLLSSFEDPAGQEEVDEAVPSLRGALQALDGRDEVLRLDKVRDRQVGERSGERRVGKEWRGRWWM